MRASSLAALFLSFLAIPVIATPSHPNDHLIRRDDAGQTDEVVDPDSLPTVFNGISVPPMKELTPDNFYETTKEGYWLVKHFSPACPHCQAIAPTWQTLYEFYQTSDPLAASSSKAPDPQSLNSFEGFYNFHFAVLNCLAYADLCNDLNIREYPRFTLYHDGDVMDVFSKEKNMKALSAFIEEKLELIRPGSRPVKGVKLPEPGASSVDRTAEPDAPAAKDKDPEAGAKAGEKHNELVAAQKAATTTAVRPAKTVIPNPQGISVPLTAENFQTLVTITREPWFVKFYAPWCSHCQALAPNWNQMAKEMRGMLNVGEVNCESEPRLCKDARVNAYPTIFFFRGGERIDYEGLRGLGDLVDYANKAVDIGTGMQDVDAASFKELEANHEVLFLYLYDHATTSEDFAALDRVMLNLVGRAKLVKSDSAALAERFKVSTWPRLLVVRDGRASYYNALAPKDMRDQRQLLDWMRTVWLPIVPELTVANAREIMDGKFVVLGVLTRKRSDDFLQAKRELKNAALEWMDKQVQLFRLERQELRDAKQLRIEEAEDRNDQRALRAAKNMRITIREDDKKPVRFAWVDGDLWERWLRTTYGIDVEHGERVIINDQDNRRYWDTSLSGNNIMASRTSILETIPLVIANPPKLKSKSTVGAFEATFFSTKSFIVNHPIFFCLLLISSIVATIMVYRGRLLKRVGVGAGGILGTANGAGFFHLEGKEGLLNGGSTGKVD